MYELDKESARKALLRESIVQPQHIDVLLSKFPAIHPPLDQALQAWLDGEPTPEIQVDGISIAEVMKNSRTSYLVAVRELNVLLVPDLDLAKRRAWREMLKRPVVFR